VRSLEKARKLLAARLERELRRKAPPENRIDFRGLSRPQFSAPPQGLPGSPVSPTETLPIDRRLKTARSPLSDYLSEESTCCAAARLQFPFATI